jgi:hypothetical protein
MYRNCSNVNFLQHFNSTNYKKDSNKSKQLNLKTADGDGTIQTYQHTMHWVVLQH